MITKRDAAFGGGGFALGVVIDRLAIWGYNKFSSKKENKTEENKEDKS